MEINLDHEGCIADGFKFGDCPASSIEFNPNTADPFHGITAQGMNMGPGGLSGFTPADYTPLDVSNLSSTGVRYVVNHLPKKSMWIRTKPPGYIVIHWVGPSPSISNGGIWSTFANGQSGTNYTIKDSEIMELIPLTHAGGAITVGKITQDFSGLTNSTSVSIETIPEDVFGKFSDKTLVSLKECVKIIRQYYGKSLPLIRHYDVKSVAKNAQGWYRKNCPNWYTPLQKGYFGSKMDPSFKSYDAGHLHGERHWEDLKKYLNS